MRLMVLAGGCGCRAASKLGSVGPDETVVCVGSPMDVAYAPEGVERVPVDVGSDTGAHRDYGAAYVRLSEGGLENVLGRVSEVVDSGHAPVVVFGLLGATGLAVARCVVENAPATLVIVGPAVGEPHAHEAGDRYDWLSEGKYFGDSRIVLVSNPNPEDEAPLSRAVELARRFPTKLDSVVNDARAGVAYVDGEPVSPEEVRRRLEIRRLEAGGGGGAGEGTGGGGFSRFL
ncbi:MAG: hypothetical protein GXO28_04340 [Methanopyri archaeon]|nr:hypothetical protein [Methanopyri archaeon]